MKVNYSYLLQQFNTEGKDVKVRYTDLPKGTNADEILAALKEQLKVCNFTLGPEVSQFEEKIAQVCQTSYAIGDNSYFPHGSPFSLRGTGNWRMSRGLFQGTSTLEIGEGMDNLRRMFSLSTVPADVRGRQSMKVICLGTL